MFYRNEITADAAPPTRQHYPWTEMEEYHPDGGMWANPRTEARNRHIEAAEALMADPDSFRDAMRLALLRWPRSVGVALTTPGLNHRAWIGHAGCFLATGSPEETTRLGWHNLDDGEQDTANAAADDVILEWKRANQPELPPQMGLWDFLPSLKEWASEDA
jgi:hypothetical protein